METQNKDPFIEEYERNGVPCIPVPLHIIQLITQSYRDGEIILVSRQWGINDLKMYLPETAVQVKRMEEKE